MTAEVEIGAGEFYAGGGVIDFINMFSFIFFVRKYQVLQFLNIHTFSTDDELRSVN
jgi:hypothetical protein